MVRAPRNDTVSRAATLLVLFGALGLGCQRGPSADDWLEKLSGSDPTEQSKAALALGRLGEKTDQSVPALMELLRTGDAQGRWSAAVALGKLGAAAVDAIPALEQVLNDKDGEVRDAAADAIEKIKRRSGQYGK